MLRVSSNSGIIVRNMKLPRENVRFVLRQTRKDVVVKEIAGT